MISAQNYLCPHISKEHEASRAEFSMWLHQSYEVFAPISFLIPKFSVTTLLLQCSFESTKLDYRPLCEYQGPIGPYFQNPRIITVQ